MLADRPHKDFEGSPLNRFDGDREEARKNGYDLNNYEWLDLRLKCTAADWPRSGKVSFPVNQLSCGACWAFTTTAALETSYAIENNISFMTDVPYLSVQQLVDCNFLPNLGCIGGEALNAYRYIKESGIALAPTYPYIEKQEKCSYTP
jgi:C1A family cysteine protease